MQELKILLCDDDKTFRDWMSGAISRFLREQGIPFSLLVGSCPAELLALPTLTEADLLFLDIDMPGTDGIRFGTQLRDHGCGADIIYVSNLDSKVYEIFKVHPWSFIRKSRVAEELEDVLCQYIAALRERSSGVMLQGVEGEMRTFGPGDIVYVESAGKNQQMFLSDGAVFSVRSSLHELEERLVPMGFIRIHKGFLVNFRYIRKIASRSVLLDTGAELPVGRDRLSSARETYLSLMKWKGLSRR